MNKLNLKNCIIIGDVLCSLALIPDESVHLIITSPPYNLSINYGNFEDEMPYDKYLEWMNSVWSKCHNVLVQGGRLCINIGENKRQNISYPTFSAFINQCIDLGFLYRGTVIWNKNSAASHTAWGSWNSCSNPHIVPRHEYVLLFSKSSYKLEGNKDLCDLNSDGKEFMELTRSIWSFGTESKSKIGHPAPFPLELPLRLIKFLSYKQNIILDPFAGSGTTGLAACKLKRNFILIDNCKEYVDIMVKRIKEHSESSIFDDFKLNIYDMELLAFL